MVDEAPGCTLIGRLWIESGAWQSYLGWERLRFLRLQAIVPGFAARGKCTRAPQCGSPRFALPLLYDGHLLDRGHNVAVHVTDGGA